MQINKTQLRNQVTLFLIFLARFAYLSVFRVSMKSRSDGDTQAIIRVRLIEKEKSFTTLIIIYKSKWASTVSYSFIASATTTHFDFVGDRFAS